jgi:DNA ligase-associated metallophosphoesterase
VPVYAGSRMPLTTYLAARVRAILHDPRRWRHLPQPVIEWLRLQRLKSELPPKDGLLIETFPRGGKWFLIAYTFEGRLAHQTLGMLVTKRMEKLGMAPLGYVGTDYVLAIWSAFEPRDVAGLFAEDILGDEMEEWLAESSMLRRTFRNIATIAGLIEKSHPGAQKSGRQMTMNSDLIYDVLRRHQPDHILLRATRAEAAQGLTDVARIASLLARVKGRIRHRVLKQVSPLAVPALIEEGREWVAGGAEDALLAEAAALVEEATDGAEHFAETLAELTDELPVRGTSVARSRVARPPPVAPRPPRAEDGDGLMVAAPVHVAGERLMLDPAGVLHWPAQRMLVVADLHFEKGSAFATRGRLVPPYDTRETLARLLPVLRLYSPRRVVFLGDSFHDAEGCARLGDQDRAALVAALAGVDVTWVAGNHDPAPPVGLPGAAVEELRDGPLTFRHIPQPRAAGEIAGASPSACHGADARRWRRTALFRQRRTACPCCRPSGAYTGGLDTTDRAIAGLFPRGGRAFLLGGERLYSFPLAPRPTMANLPVSSFGGGGAELPVLAGIKLRNG